MPTENPITSRGPSWSVWTLTLALALLAPAAWGANTIYTWDASGTHPAAPTDGSGTWAASSPYWTTGGASDVAFGNSTTSQANIGSTNGAAGTISVSGTVTLNTILFDGTTSGNCSLGGSGTLSMGGSSPTIAFGAASLSPTINSVIGEASAGTTVYFGTATGSRGTLTLGGANTFTGAAVLNQATVNFNNLQLGGTASSFGAGNNTQPVVIDNDYDYTTLNYTGTGGSTDRPFQFAGKSASSSLNNNGSGAISFNNIGSATVAYSGGDGAWNRCLTLGGTYTGSANTFAELVSDMPGFATSLTVNGSIWNLTGVNTYTGGTTISAGTLQIASPTYLPGAVTQSGTGQLWLVNGNATFTNNFTLSTKGDGLYGAIGFNGPNTVLSGTLTLQGNSRIGTYGSRVTPDTISGQITGSGGMEFFGQNTANGQSQSFTLSNTGNNYNGDTSITNADYGSVAKTGCKLTLILGASEVIPNGAGKGNVVFNGADANHLTILDVAGQTETINGFTVSGTAAGAVVDDSTGTGSLIVGDNNTASAFSGVIQNTGGTLALTKIGAGKLTLSGANTYSGGTTASAGTLQLGAANAVPGSPSAGDVTVNSTLDLNTYSDVINGLNGSGTVDTVAGGTPTLTVGANGDNGSFSGVIQNTAGRLALTKSGAGTLTLSGANTYTGGTTISAGTLAISGHGSIGASGNLAIAGGATLDVSGATGGYTLGTGQTLVAGNGTSLVNGNLSLGGAALALFWTNGVPSLTISSNVLTMNNNATTVTVAGSAPLAVGGYKIISKGAGGSVSGAVSNSPVNVAGAGAGPGSFLQITSGELYLNVVHNGNSTTTTLNSSAPTQTYGNAVTFTASVSPANATGNVTFTNGTTACGTVPLTNGVAVLTLAGGALNVGLYQIVASYGGNGAYSSSVSGVVTQTISRAFLAVAGNNVSRWVGNANPFLTASYRGFVAGDTTSVLTGAPSLTTTATTGSPIGNYPITVTRGTLADASGHYTLVYSNGTLAVIARALPFPQGTAFPLMLYEVDDAPSAASEAAYGWNIVQEYGMANDSDINSYLQVAYSDSLGGDATIPCNGSASTNFVEWPQSQVQAWIQGADAGNNIAWWDMPEEMRSWKSTEVQLLQDYHAWVRLYDTNGPRPTYEYTPSQRTYSQNINVAANVDIVGCSCYCEKQGQPHAWVRYKVAETGVHAITAAGATVGGNYLAGQKIAVPVLYLSAAGDGSIPTPAQSYHDVWSSIASGALGINVYSYYHVRDNPALTNNLNQFNLAASQISGSEIGSVILYGTKVANVTFTVTSGPTLTDSFAPGDGNTWQYPSINVLCKTWSNNVYVVAVNSTSNTVAAIITNLPATTGSATLPFELRTVPVSGNGFADTFPPWGAHVYKLATTSAPVITNCPASQAVPVGSNVVFTVTAGGVPAPSYQWSFNGTALSGATGASLVLTNAQTTNSGTYVVAVTNLAGSNGCLATLTVSPPPVIGLAAPTNNAGFVAPATISLLATVTTNGNTINSVSFYNWGTNLIASVSSAPYAYSWTNVSAGVYSLTARLAYNNGSTVNSGPARLILAAQPAVTSPRFNQGALSITFTTELGPVYEVEYQNVLGGPVWQLLTNVAGTSLPVTVTDNAATNTSRFYRVQVQ